MKRYPNNTQGFTLTEVLIVMGLISMLMSLLLPVVGKARLAARSTACLSNLRQMSNAWNMYTAANHGRLMHHIFFTPAMPDLAWSGYWPGVLDEYGVRGAALVCPTASEISEDSTRKGFGSASLGWTGKYFNDCTGIKLNDSLIRESSYGMNAYLTVGGFGDSNKITAVRNITEVPLFMDCVMSDTSPDNPGTPPPPNLHGDQVTAASPNHWRFLIARHGRAINMAMADGSARRVPLDETYLLTWTARWVPTRLDLPSR
jgi:prepilin-type N-terminal cleavage/methylation domain-containing protein/prepilin-type processing-associated H-X9-DG protein